jgi:nitrate reductase NapE component
LTKLFQVYKSKFGDVLHVHQPSSTTEGKNKSAGMTYMVMMMLVLRYMLLSLIVVGDLGLVLLMFNLLLHGLLMHNLSCLYTLIVILSINLMTISAS